MPIRRYDPNIQFDQAGGLGALLTRISNQQVLLAGSRVMALDGLRTVAVMMVLLHHAVPRVFPGGYFGVDIFFALSGYLITARLLHEKDKFGSIWLKGFYIRRFLRLSPALVIVVVVVVLTEPLTGAGATPLQGLMSVTYLMDFYMSFAQDFGGALGHTWSLAVEEQFYLIWPAVLIIGLRRRWRLVYVTAAWMILAIVPTLLVAREVGYEFGYFAPFAHVGELGAGVLLALVLNGRHYTVVRWSYGYAAPALGLVVFGTAVFTVHQSAGWLYYGGFTAAGMLAASVIAHCIVRPDGIVARALSVRSMVWIGKRSYGVYLWHYPVLFALRRFVPEIPALVVGLALSLVLAALSFRFVEQRFNAVKDNRYQRTNS